MAKTNVVNAFETNTADVVDDTDTSIEVETTDGLPPTPFYIGLRPRDNENREYAKVEAVNAGNILDFQTLDNRFLDGSAVDSGQSHPTGTPVKIVVAAQLFEDIWEDLDAKATENYVDTQVSDHESAADPHSQYLDQSDGDSRYLQESDAFTESDGDARYLRRQLHIERTDKDADGIFRTVKQIRDDGTVYSESVLGPDGDGPEYPERTVTWYEADGTTTRDTITYDLTYDSDGDLISEAVQ